MIEATLAHGNWRYEVTPDDVLWLSRAVAHEGAPMEGVADALVARFVWLQVNGYRQPETLGKFVQSYSQPVNRRWAKGGDKYEAKYRTADAGGRRVLDARSARIMANRSHDGFRDDVVAAVASSLDHDGPVKWTDFHRDGDQPGPWTQVTEETPGRNTFYRLDAMPADWEYQARSATDRADSPAAPDGVGPVLVAIGVALVALKYWWKS